MGTSYNKTRVVMNLIIATYGVFVVVIQICSIASQEPRNTEGTEFVVGFMENLQGDENTQLVIVNSQDNQMVADLSVESPYGTNTWFFSVEDSYLLTLPTFLLHTGNERSIKGIRVTSTLPVTVYGMNGLYGEVDTYLALPNTVLDKEYIVITYAVNQLHSDGGSQFLIIGVEDDTFVKLTVTGPVTYDGISFSAGSSFSFTLNSLDSVQFQSQSDLTGSIVSSSKPISLFSGNKCDNVPSDVYACDHMVSQVPPLSLWGDSYITTPLATRTAGDVFRVLASEDSTTVTISGLSAPIVLNSGQFREIVMPSNESWLITADAPILVTQFCKSEEADSVGGDPFMMILPSLDNFISGAYELITLDIPDKSKQYFINILVDCTVKFQLTSDPPISVTWLSTPQHLGLCVGTAELNNGNYILTYSEAKYQILLYALASFAAYGHPMALQFDDQDNSPCLSSPCLNDGTCVPAFYLSSYTCNCVIFTKGNNCENLNPCLSSPCQNGGVCTPSSNFTSYTCACPNTRAGDHCEETIDPSPCLSIPCFNDGTCVPAVDLSSYTCKCITFAMGNQCENLNPCLSNPCQNGGVCTPSSNFTSYTCACPSTHAGEYCEETSIPPSKTDEAGGTSTALILGFTSLALTLLLGLLFGLFALLGLRYLKNITRKRVNEGPNELTTTENNQSFPANEELRDNNSIYSENYETPILEYEDLHLRIK